ncbi:hypothetical protein WA538_001528, partial [Blastocystis sp. DL]
MKAKSVLPKELSAGTGKVGFRCPNHPVVRELLRVSQLPIAAPSANKFGHISPTRAQHVYDDLHEWPVQILDGGEVVCQVGIESTVIGIDCEHSNIILFRRGGVTDHSILQCLREHGIEMQISEPVKHVAMKMEEAQVAPGQLITHYAPRCDAFLVQLQDKAPIPSIVRERIASTVVLDFNHILEAYKPFALQYMTLSDSGSVAEAMRNIYGVLRTAELVDGVRMILLPDLTGVDDELAPSVMDRIVRSTSGRMIQLPRNPV